MRAPSRRARIVLALVLVSTASAGPLDETDADGRATLRGFLGAYSIEAKLPDGRTKKTTFYLKKGDTPQTVEVEF